MSSRIEDHSAGEYPYGLWLGAVRRATFGKRGQAVLRELEAALLALPQKRLIDGAICREGDVCVLGALALRRKVAAGMGATEARRELAEHWPVEDFDDRWELREFSKEQGLTYALAWEAMAANDEDARGMTPEGRYEYVLAWVRKRLREVAA